MDAHRFDAIARVFAGRRSRRGAIKALTGILVAGAATRAVIHDARACLGHGDGPCDTREECCAGLGCSFGSCAPCFEHNVRCANTEECCAGLICNKHKNCTKGLGGKKKKAKGKGRKHR
jgi:hypothetical protein